MAGDECPCGDEVYDLPPMGTCVIDERIIIPIVGLWLIEGCIEVICDHYHLECDLPAGTYEYRVHAMDGTLVYRAPVTMGVDIEDGTAIELKVRIQTTRRAPDATAEAHIRQHG